MSDTAQPEPAYPTPPPRAMFDLAKLDLLSPSEGGKAFVLAHTYDRLGFAIGPAYTGSDGKPVTITLMGQNSAVGRDTLKRIRDERAAMDSNGQRVSEEATERHNTEYLCALTKGWTIERLDGADFPVTPANREKLWTDPRFRWLREPALTFIARDSNFLAPPDGV